MRLIDDRVMIKEVDMGEDEESSIIIPDSAKQGERHYFGEVIEVGGAVIEDIEEGDIVIYDKYAVKVIEVDEEKYLVVREYDILAKIEEEN